MLIIGVGNLISLEGYGYEFIGGDEEDLDVDERRVSRIFFTVESLVLLDDGQGLLLFKLNLKRKKE